MPQYILEMNVLENHWVDGHKGIPPFSTFAVNKMSKSGISLKRFVPKNCLSVNFIFYFLIIGSVSLGIGIQSFVSSLKRTAPKEELEIITFLKKKIYIKKRYKKYYFYLIRKQSIRNIRKK